jgi:hypothetical protein
MARTLASAIASMWRLAGIFFLYVGLLLICPTLAVPKFQTWPELERCNLAKHDNSFAKPQHIEIYKKMVYESGHMISGGTTERKYLWKNLLDQPHLGTD